MFSSLLAVIESVTSPYYEPLSSCTSVDWLAGWSVDWYEKLNFDILSENLCTCMTFGSNHQADLEKNYYENKKFATFLLNLRMLIELFALRRKKITTVNNLPNDRHIIGSLIYSLKLFDLLFLAGIIIFWKFENQGNTILTTLNSLLFVLTVC